MAEKLPIPNFGILKNRNPYTGSKGDFNFNIVPVADESLLKCKVWYGTLNCANSKIAAEENFSLDTEGYEKMKEWFAEQAGGAKKG